ncbi:MAG: ROK family transcriptional regulator [Acidobacteria bacterium]|nr:ROK family transcriptional regulator [Acidobacteriota bacterium]
MPPRDQSQKLLFRSARNAVITALLRNEALSRSELSEITGVSPAAITEVAQAFLQRGLIVELPSQAGGRRGRPIVQLKLDASHSCFVGLSVGEAKTPLVITDLRGRVLQHQPLAAYKTPSELTEAAGEALSKALRTASIPRSRLHGIGIAVSGIVNAGEGICRYSAALNWKDVPVARLLAKALHLPVWIENDANAVAVGEKFFGRARSLKHFSSIILGPAIGSAHYINDMLYRGHDGSAGEIGHITIDPKGVLCRCGRRGCLDTIAGGHALRDAAKAAGLSATNMRGLEDFALHGSAVASRLLRSAGNALGFAAASLVHLNSPQCLIFTDIEGFGNGVFRTAIRQSLENNIMARFLGSTQVVFTDADTALLPRSAASIAAFEYLNSI